MVHLSARGGRHMAVSGARGKVEADPRRLKVSRELSGRDMYL